MAGTSQEQNLVFHDALVTARKELQAAEEKLTTLANEEIALKRHMWLLQRVIDAFEIQLGEATVEEVFKRNKQRGAASRKP